MVSQNGDAQQNKAPVYLNAYSASIRTGRTRHYVTAHIAADAWSKDAKGVLHPQWLEATIDTWVAESGLAKSGA